MPAPNEATLTGLVEGDMYFLKVVAGTADGQFDGASSPVAVATPIQSVGGWARRHSSTNDAGVLKDTIRVEAYDETFCRLSWEKPGKNGPGTGPAATHFAVAYLCGSEQSLPLQIDPRTTVYNETFTATTATLNVPFNMDAKCTVSHFCAGLSYHSVKSENMFGWGM